MIPVRFLFKALVFLLALAATPAHAIFIYVDLNNNPDEIDAIRAGLKDRAPKGPETQLLSVPEQDPVRARELSRLIRARDNAYDLFERKQCYRELTCQAVPDGACRPIYLDLKAKEKAAADSQKTRFTAEMLDAALSKVTLKPGEPVELAISGHDGGGNFEGNLGNLSYDDLKKIGEHHPEIALNVQALYLLGCYTNTPPLIEQNWREVFPGAELVGGYWDRSPRGDRPVNGKILRKLVGRAGAYAQDVAAKDFLQALSELRPFRGQSLSLAVCDLYGRAGGKPEDLNQLKVDLAACKQQLTQADLKYYQDIFSGKIPFPASGEPAKLRAYYGRLRSNANCLSDPAFLQQQPNVPNPDNVLRLVLYRSLVSDVKRMHQTDFSNLDTLLTGLGFGPEDLFSKVDLMNRASLLDWQRRVLTKLDQSADAVRAGRAKGAIQGIYDTLVNTSPGCVSVMMLEGSPQRSSCINLEGTCQ